MAVIRRQVNRCIVKGCERTVNANVCNEHRMDICHPDSTVILCEECGELIRIDKRLKGKYNFEICEKCSRKDKALNFIGDRDEYLDSLTDLDFS